MYRTIDLCAGIGGIRKGFELTGHYYNVLSAEIDEYAARTYELNFDGDNPRNDLTSTEFKKEAERIGCDILLAGFPCQPFSSQGNKEGLNDPTRGTIFYHIRKIIKLTRPKVVFLENVQNLISHDKGRTIQVILDSLEKKLQYKVVGVTYDEKGKYCFTHSSFVRNTCNFGLPQNRPRAYFVAFDKRLYAGLLDEIENQLPTCLYPELKKNKNLGRKMPQILDKKVDIHYYMSKTYLNTLFEHRARQLEKGNGFGYCILNSNGEFKNANTLMATGGSGKERNLIIQKMPSYDPNNPSVLKKKGGLNDQDVRIMTPTEWGRLQGFIGYAFLDEQGKDMFRFPEGMPEGQKYKQFGNSVSIPVIQTMAEFIWRNLQRLNENKEIIILNYLDNHSKVSKNEVASIFDISDHQAGYILKNMANRKQLCIHKQGKNTYYSKEK